MSEKPTVEPQTQRSEPDAPPSTTDGGVVCPQCGATNPPGTTVCRATPTCGSFLPRNGGALKHGLMSKFVELPPDLQDMLDRFESGVTTDLGGESELTTIERSYVHKLKTLETLVHLALLYIQRAGFNAKSEQMLLQAIDRWDRLALRLGMARRQKRVDPLDAIHAAVAEANKPC